jgi:dynamin 1-like protein
MSSVIQDKQDQQKKAIAAEERRKRDKRRMKELGGVNGVETPEDDEEVEETKPQTLPHRAFQQKQGRSMSPAVSNGVNGRSSSPPRFGGAGQGNAKDSFLNYFFGKEGGLPASNPPRDSAVGGTAAAAAAGNRHITHGAEPSFSQSIRRGDNRVAAPSQSSYSQSHDRDDYDNRSTYDYVCATSSLNQISC